MKLISIEKSPNVIFNKKLKKFLNPDCIYIPLNKAIEKSYYKKNENIYDNYYASISGKVIPNKKYIKIENDFKEKTEFIFKNKKKISINRILEVTKSNKKLYDKFKEIKTCKNLVISAINDEVYVLNNIILLKENLTDILDMIDELAKIYDSKNSILVIKNNDTEVIDHFFNIMGTYSNIKLTLVDDKYLIGNEEVLLNKLKLVNNQTLFLTIEELIDLNQLLKYEIPSDTKIITISGDAIKESIIIEVKKYTMIKERIDKYIKIIDQNYGLYKNNLLQENKISLDDIITDSINSIHLMKKKDFLPSECTNCGMCLKVCPKGINIPKQLKSGKINPKCINCGICNYICPSYINIRKKLVGDKDDNA